MEKPPPNLPEGRRVDAEAPPNLPEGRKANAIVI